MHQKIKTGSRFFVAAFAGVALLILCFLLFRESPKEARTPDSAGKSPTESVENFLMKTRTTDNAFPQSKSTTRLLPRNLRFNGGNVIIKSGENEESNDGVEFSEGDLYELYGGGRDDHPSNTPNAKDNRLWIDAKIPVEISSKLKLYGVSTMTLGATEENSISTYTRNYSLGGGFGLSYRVSDSVELDFDYRRTRPLDSGNEDPSTTAAGISVKLSF